MARNGDTLRDQLFCGDGSEGARWGLLALMTGLSEACWVAGWMDGLEVALWRLADLGALDPGRRPRSRVHRQALCAVAYLHIQAPGVGLAS